MAVIPSSSAIAHALIASAADPCDIDILLGGKYPKTYAKDWRKWRLMAACALNVCGYCPAATRQALEISGELPPSSPADVPNAHLRQRAQAAQDRLIDRGLDVSMV